MEPAGSLGQGDCLDGAAAGTTPAAAVVQDNAGTSRLIIGGSSPGVGDDDKGPNSAAGGLVDGEILPGGGSERGISTHGNRTVVNAERHLASWKFAQHTRRNPIGTPSSSVSSSNGGGLGEVVERLPLDRSNKNPIGKNSVKDERCGSGEASWPPDTPLTTAWCVDNCTSSLEDLVCWTKGLDYDAAVKGF